MSNVNEEIAVPADNVILALLGKPIAISFKLTLRVFINPINIPVKQSSLALFQLNDCFSYGR